MTNELQPSRMLDTVAELKAMNSPPLLSCENAETYDAILAGLVEAHKPWDFTSKMLVRMMADASWDMFRYGRHKTIGIERKFREQALSRAREAQAASKLQKQRAADKEAEKDLPPLSAEFERFFDLSCFMENTKNDLSKPYDRAERELLHAKALEDGITYHEQLDGLLNGAIKRFHLHFMQLQQYRELAGPQNNEAHPVVEGEFQELPSNGNPGPSIAPQSMESKQ